MQIVSKGGGINERRVSVGVVSASHCYANSSSATSPRPVATSSVSGNSNNSHDSSVEHLEEEQEEERSYGGGMIAVSCEEPSITLHEELLFSGLCSGPGQTAASTLPLFTPGGASPSSKMSPNKCSANRSDINRSILSGVGDLGGVFSDGPFSMFMGGDLHNNGRNEAVDANNINSIDSSIAGISSFAAGVMETIAGSNNNSLLLNSANQLHTCTICPKSFQSRADVVRHMRTHTGERPYNCPHCHYSAALKGNLKSHVLSRHTPQKNNRELSNFH